MASFDEQLNSVWLLTVGENGKNGVGGALCYNEDGYLITARHVVEGIADAFIIKGRKCDSSDWYNIEYLFEYPTLDLAILKIQTSSKEDGKKLKFPFTSFKAEIRLNPDEALVCHGHGANIPFVSRFGKTGYPYQPCDNISNILQNLQLTYESLNDAELANIRRKGSPTPLFRTVAGVLDKKAHKVKQMHPYLPLIEQNEKCLPGFSGCPVFRVDSGDVVGIFSFSHGGSGYIVPAQIICYAIKQLSGLTI